MVDAHDLRLALDDLLAAQGPFGRHAAIRSLARRPSPFATRVPAEVVEVVFEDGATVSLFAKSLSPNPADNPDKGRRDREIRVYEELLDDADLPVATYYGCARHGVRGRQTLLLEYVDDWSLKYQDLEHWFTAARRLAQLHLHFASRADQVLDRDFLLRLDARYCYQWLERAVGVVASRSAEFGAELTRVIEQYGRVVAVLEQQPATLVHNDLAPKNVLADRSSSPCRICFVDWELAGVGCGLLDLVHLKHGLEPAAENELISAYLDELAGTVLCPTSQAELRRVVAACEAHQTIYRLAFSSVWGLPLATVARWVTEARHFAEQV